MHTYIAARHGKCVDRRIIDRKEGKPHPGIVAHCGQPTTQLIQVGFDIGIVKIGRITPSNLVHDLLADFLLGGQRQLVTRHITQFGQIIRQNRLGQQ